MTQTAPIACVGAGLVGRAWALVFAAAGRPVRIYDQRAEVAEAARGFATEMLPARAKEDLLAGADPGEVFSRLSVASSLEGALKGATHVQESTPEDLTIKRVVFSRLDSAADPAATLASSTSALLPSSFTEDLPGRARCLGRASDQPALSDPRRRSRAGALDRCSSGRGDRGTPARLRHDADRDEART